MFLSRSSVKSLLNFDNYYEKVVCKKGYVDYFGLLLKKYNFPIDINVFTNIKNEYAYGLLPCLMYRQAKDLANKNNKKDFVEKDLE